MIQDVRRYQAACADVVMGHVEELRVERGNAGGVLQRIVVVAEVGEQCVRIQAPAAGINQDVVIRYQRGIVGSEDVDRVDRSRVWNVGCRIVGEAAAEHFEGNATRGVHQEEAAGVGIRLHHRMAFGEVGIECTEIVTVRCHDLDTGLSRKHEIAGGERSHAIDRQRGRLSGEGCKRDDGVARAEIGVRQHVRQIVEAHVGAEVDDIALNAVEIDDGIVVAERRVSVARIGDIRKDIAAGAAGQGVVAAPTVDQVVAALALQRIVATIAGDEVVEFRSRAPR